VKSLKRLFFGFSKQYAGSVVILQVEKMDDKDVLLITLLRRDARLPIVALARELNLSRTATQERLGKLVANGSISKFTIVEGNKDASRQGAHLLIKLQKGVQCAQVVPKLKSVAEALAIHSVAGEYDIVMQIDAQSIQLVEAARAKIVAVKGIAEVVTLVALQRHLN
jgi:Lrp/AsnC family transcriptional regulator, leucine-responsive regulatory protein